MTHQFRDSSRLWAAGLLPSALWYLARIGPGVLGLGLHRPQLTHHWILAG
jgi:hypothetical protein